MAMVVRANRSSAGSAAISRRTHPRQRCTKSGSTTFFRAKGKDTDADHVYFQGHAAPGIYARAFLEGRLSAEKLHHFRRELEPAAAYHPIRIRG